MNITFNEEDHTYTIDGCPVPPVTHVIKNTVGTGWEASPWYLQRGKAIHACAAFIAQGIDFKFDERLAPYVAALKKFFKEIIRFYSAHLIHRQTYVHKKRIKY